MTGSDVLVMDKGRVLVIDDDPRITRALERILSNEADTVCVDAAQAALQILTSDRRFDAIVCDIHMEGISGPDLRNRLRELAPQLLPRMIFMTGNSHSALSQQVTNHFIIEKPFDSASVRSIVAQVIHASRTEGFRGPTQTERISPEFAAAAPPELLRALEQESGTVYAIDDAHRIVFVNPAWYTFAAENRGERLLRDAILGLSLRSVVPDVLQRFYDAGLGHAWASGKAWEHEYECSSDIVFRKFRMRVLPLLPSRFAIISNDLIREEPFSASAPSAELEYRSESGMVVQCAHCRRVCLARSDTWHWLPAFVKDPPAQVSHGLCAPCAEYHYP